jgi:hypothetical protein
MFLLDHNKLDLSLHFYLYMVLRSPRSEKYHIFHYIFLKVATNYVSIDMRI